MTVKEIYEKYEIMNGLQMHMLRVAAVARIVCENFTETIDKDTIVLASLFHDMGNIIKSDLDVFPEFLEPQGREYWEKVKKEYIEKYGNDAVGASARIMREIGLSERAVEVVAQNKFSMLCEHRDGNDMEVKITHYADGRVDPYGVVSYIDRMEDARRRYEVQNKSKEAERVKLVACGAEIEKQIFEKCSIKPEDITDEVIAPIIEELKNFVIR